MRGLYAITPELSDTTELIEQVRQAIAGGASVVQYRSKRATPDLARTQALALRALTSATETLFIVNDDSDFALSVGADGVHLGRDDGDVQAIPRIRQQSARRPAQDRSTPFMIGVSCYNEMARGQAAIEAGADYIAFGSFFPSPTKVHAARAEIALIRRAKAKFSVPVVAIGGITVDNAPQLIAADVDAVAVISGLFDADDIERRARAFTNLFNSENHVHQ
jgi:thiamine-phosphate pyrophosphorylase